MSVATQDTAVSTGRITRAFIYLVLILFALFYLGVPDTTPVADSDMPLGSAPAVRLQVLVPEPPVVASVVE